MTSRVDLARARVHPWQFPPLEEPVRLAPEPEEAAELAPEALEYDAHAEAVRAELERGYREGLERGRAEGGEAGYAAGYAAGAAAAEAEAAERAQLLAALIGRLDRPIGALEERVEEAVAGLALEVARAVIGGEVARSRDYLIRLIRGAIAQVPIEMGAPRVVVNPADLELLGGLAPDLDRLGAVLLGDDIVEAGGCLIIADGDDAPVKDRRWHARSGEGAAQVNLTLPSRWRSAMLTLFDGEEG